MNIENLLREYPTIRLLFIEANILAIVFLLIIVRTRKEFNADRLTMTSHKLFNHITIGTIITLILDSCMWAFNMQTFFGARLFNLISSTLCFIMTPIVSYIAVKYMHSKVLVEPKNRDFWDKILFIPVIITTILAIINIWTGWVFTISKDNTYTRGSIFLIYTILSFAYLLYASLIALITSRKQTYLPAKKEYRILATFVIPAFIGGILQTITGLSFTWVGVTVSIFILYVTVQNYQLLMDPLIGIGNRRNFEIHLAEHIQHTNTSGRLFTIMVDIDRFKYINDTYGHNIGDKVLIIFGHILGEVSYLTNTFSFRYGGDEFVIIGSSDNPQDLIDKVIRQIMNKLDEYNNSIDNTLPRLDFSYGQTIYDDSIDKNGDAFINRADKAMYENKINKKVS